MSRRRSRKVQASQPSYELHTLGWRAFQHLCVSVVSDVWGQTVQGFFDSHDGGRDGAFYGTWLSDQEERFDGTFTVQCKFFSSSRKFLKLSDLKDELTKAKKLAAQGLAQHYFIITNAQLKGVDEATIRAAFEVSPNLLSCRVFGTDRLSQLIRESSRLRMLVPRVYGLGDLSQILDERSYDQAQEILSAFGEDLSKFVVTDAYQRSVKAVLSHGFVLLLGEPACGKSTIAAALAVASIDEWKCSTIKVRDADDFVAHSNPHERKQFFWVDDAFGATQLDVQKTIAWNAAFPHLQAAIRRGARFVFTSRTHIFRAAQKFLKISALSLLPESQVVIRVEQLSKEEKDQILYNHIRLGTQPKTFKREIKPYLPLVAAHQQFSPEIARRLGSPAFTRRLVVSGFGLQEFVAHPMELLQENINSLDQNCQAAIAFIFMRGGVVSSPIAMLPSEEQAIALMGGSVGGIKAALKELDGSFLALVQSKNDYAWRFKHPTIRDAFAGIVAADRDLMDVYLTGTPLDQMFLEISCGDVGVVGVKVIVPSSRFRIVIERIEHYLRQDRDNQDSVNRFLAHRCDFEFLKQFASRNTDYVGSLSIGSYFYAVSDVGLIARLREFELISETDRLRHVAAICQLAIDVPDSGFLNGSAGSILTDDERSSLLSRVRSELLANVDSVLMEWHSNIRPDDEPDDYFDHLKSALTDYRDAFNDDEEALKWITTALADIDALVEELSSSRFRGPDRDEYYEGKRTSPVDEKRSVFDDVDQ